LHHQALGSTPALRMTAATATDVKQQLLSIFGEDAATGSSSGSAKYDKVHYVTGCLLLVGRV
jgi:hypothetical protein